MKKSIVNVAKYVSIPAIVLLTLYVGIRIYHKSANNSSGEELSSESCNIALVPIEGSIVTGPADDDDETTLDDTMKRIYDAESDKGIRGILVQINSSGGSPFASEEISNELKRTGLPTISLIREGGLSAAYQIATGADFIMASEMSDVGSIGITASYLDNVKENEMKGLHYNELSIGKYKGMGSPDRTLTPDERALIERDLKISREIFVREIAKNRNVPFAQIDRVADGSSMMGTMALKAGLIDAIGDQEAARGWLAKQLDIAPEEVVFCK